MYIEKLKKFCTKLLPIRLQAGYSINADNVIPIKALPSIRQFESGFSKTSNHYHIKTRGDGFEVVGFVRLQRQTFYQLKHILTGEVIIISKNAMELVFDRSAELTVKEPSQ